MKKPKGPGRPKFEKGKAREETLRIRVTKEEKALIEKQSGNPSEWARTKLMTGLLPDKPATQ